MRLWRTAQRYWHTLRHLRPVQWTNRARRLLLPARPDLRPAPPSAALPIPREPIAKPAGALGNDRYCYLHQTHVIRSPVDLLDPAISRLWRYHWHYFDDFAAVADSTADAGQRNARLQAWLRDFTPGTPDAWDPYPIALRTVNWIKAARLQRIDLDQSALDSLAAQLRLLSAAPEYHLLGNHLLADAKALLIGGAYFTGDEAERWRAQGMQIYRQQLPEQILADGAHYELSPMYHATILEDLLDVYNLVALGAPATSEAPQLQTLLPSLIEQMLRWSAALTHPDGGPAFFNDATLDHAPNYRQLVDYAARLELPTHRPIEQPTEWFAESGFIRSATGPAVVLLDVGRIGPDEIPGHAHADSLSYELSLDGHRALVNSGVSCYGDSPERLRQRGTAAHNTVVVDGLDSSEVWSGFRVARRAYPVPVNISAEPNDVTIVSGGHTGYRRLPGRVTHNRTWRIARDGLLITDQLIGRYQSATAYTRLHPAWRVLHSNETGAAWRHEQTGRVMELSVSNGRLILHEGTWHPGFGCSEPCSELRIDFHGPECIQRWTWDVGELSA